jgi:hypothetical protein
MGLFDALFQFVYVVGNLGGTIFLGLIEARHAPFSIVDAKAKSE